MGGPKIGVADASKRIFEAKIGLKLAIHLPPSPCGLPPSPCGLRRTSRWTSPVLALAGFAGRALVPFGAGVSRLGVQGCWFGPGRFYWVFARHVPCGGARYLCTSGGFLGAGTWSWNRGGKYPPSPCGLRGTSPVIGSSGGLRTVIAIPSRPGAFWGPGRGRERVVGNTTGRCRCASCG